MRTKPGENDPSFKVSNDKRVRICIWIYTHPKWFQNTRVTATRIPTALLRHSTFRSKPPVFHQVSIDRTIFENTCIVQLSLDHDATRLALPGNEYRSSCSAVQQLFLPSSPAHLVYTRVYASTSSTFNSKRIRDSKTCACLLYVYPCVVLEWTRKGCRFTPHHLHSLPLPLSLSPAWNNARERETII